ncbi:hypothetical protein EON65_26150 [archaeon]|nr:MAG: hypothetical protein EON65_26150 [archaeon]
MFYQVHGKKQWYFIDPYDTFLAYPLSVVGMAANALMVLWPDQYNKKVMNIYMFVLQLYYIAAGNFSGLM